jgi:hypothetical protein
VPDNPKVMNSDECNLCPIVSSTVGFGWMQNLILTNFKKTVPQSEFVCKSYDRFTEVCPGHDSERRNMTRNQNQVRQKQVVCDSKG